MKIQLILKAKVVEWQGKKKAKLENPEYYQQQIDQFYPGTDLEIIVKRKSKKQKRSNNMNSYWHKVCFLAWAEILGAEEMEEGKAYCSHKFIDTKVRKNPQGKEYEIKPTTSGLNLSEGWEFTERMIKNAALHGHIILTPCEAGYNCARKNCETCNKIAEETSEEIDKNYPTENDDPSKILF